MKSKYVIAAMVIGSIFTLAAGCNKQEQKSNTQLLETYINSKYKYQVSYFKDWTPTELQDGKLVRFIAPPVDSSRKYPNTQFWITVDDNASELKPTDYLTNKGLGVNKDFVPKNYTVGGQQGIRTTITAFEHVYVTRSKYIYSITKFIKPLETSKLDDDTFNNVIASFKFTQ